MQNAAARLIYKLPKHSSVSQIIRELHWLRIDERIVYKILVIVFKHFCCISPDNLHKILQIDNAETRHLKLEHFTTRNGRRSFSYVAPRFWNKLPLALRTLTDIVVFKKQLKFNIFNNIGNIMGAVKMYIVWKQCELSVNNLVAITLDSNLLFFTRLSDGAVFFYIAT